MPSRRASSHLRALASINTETARSQSLKRAGFALTRPASNLYRVTRTGASARQIVFNESAASNNTGLCGGKRLAKAATSNERPFSIRLSRFALPPSAEPVVSAVLDVLESIAHSVLADTKSEQPRRVNAELREMERKLESEAAQVLP